MLAKAICLSIQTVAVILSLRPPKSSSTKEKADKVKDEGILYHLMIKLMIDCGPPALLASTALYIILMIQGVISDELKAWQVYATILSVFGYLLRAWAFRTLGRFFTYALTIRQNHRLVQDGPYKYLCHPSYTGAFITNAAYVFTFAYEGYWTEIIAPRLPIPITALLPLLIYLSFNFTLIVLRIRGEERMLSQHFGSEWKEYTSHRWRLIPFVF